MRIINRDKLEQIMPGRILYGQDVCRYLDKCQVNHTQTVPITYWKYDDVDGFICGMCNMPNQQVRSKFCPQCGARTFFDVQEYQDYVYQSLNNGNRAYVKTKFNEKMCSNCFHLFNDYEYKSWKFCPFCSEQLVGG